MGFSQASERSPASTYSVGRVTARSFDSRADNGQAHPVASFGAIKTCLFVGDWFCTELYGRRRHFKLFSKMESFGDRRKMIYLTELTLSLSQGWW